MSGIQLELDFDGAELLETKVIPSTRKTVSLPPRQGSAFTSRQEIIINLPNDQLIDLSEARCEMDINMVAATGSVNSFVSESCWSLVRTATVYSGNGEELERLDDVHVLASALHDLQNADWRSTTGRLMGINSIANKQASFGSAGVPGRSYSMDLSVMGFFAMSTYLPAFLLSTQPYLQLSLNADAVALTDTSGPATPPQFNISNVRLIVSQVDVPSEFKMAHRQILAEGGAIKLLFDSFQMSPEDILAGATQKDLKAGFYKSSLKSVMVVPRLQANINNTLVNELDRVFDNYQDWQVMLSSVQYPRTPMRLDLGAPTAYAELTKAMALHRSNSGTNLDDDYTTAFGGDGLKFMVATELGCKNDSLGRNCGVNTRTNPSSLNIQMRHTAAVAANITYSVYGHFNAELVITAAGMSRSD